MKKTIFLAILTLLISNTSFAEIKQSDVVSFNCGEIENFLKAEVKNKEIVEFAKRLQARKCK